MNKKNKYTLLPFESEVIKKRSYKENLTKYINTCSYCGNTVNYYHGFKPDKCPYCDKSDFIKPLTETRLFLLQKKYFELDRNQDVLGSMYLILFDYAQSLVKTLLPKTFTYHYSKIEEVSSDAVNIIITSFLEKKDFKIDFSFGGLLITKLKQVMWNKKIQNEENHSSLQSLISDDNDKNFLEINDVESIFPHYTEYIQQEHDKQSLLKGLDLVIAKITDQIELQYNLYQKLILLIGICQFVQNKGEIGNLYKVFGSKYFKEILDKAMVLIYEFIKEHNCNG